LGLATVQQNAGNLAARRLFNSGLIHAKLSISQPDDPYEQEADRIANHMMATPAHHGVSGTPPRLQRFCV
jgi:hypothetical protein